MGGPSRFFLFSFITRSQYNVGANASQSRTILLAGFGGLLLLMAFAGFDATRAMWETQSRNEEIQREFLSRSRRLDEIRSDVYLSGTYVRDFLLEPEPSQAERYRSELNRLRREMDRETAAYSLLVPSGERQPFSVLQQRLTDFWRSIDPVFAWNPDERRLRGYEFARDEVLPRRAAMLGLADQIALTNEGQLSAASQRVAELFSRVRTRLVITLILTLGIGVLLALFSSRRILALERQAAARLEEVTQARTELKELSARLLEVQENERRSIARELHDEVGQSLSAVLVALSNLAAEIPETVRPWLERHVESVRKLAESSVAAVRNLALLLRPSMLDDLGLVPALQWQARETARRTGMLVKVATENVSDDLADEHKTCVYRVVQEALHNASRHAAAKQVRVTVKHEQKRLLVLVQDDGRGFDPRKERGLGLLGMEERVTHLGGSFEIQSEPGKGTLLAVDLPLEVQMNRRTA
jgi:signal transduction histidine kinase